MDPQETRRPATRSGLESFVVDASRKGGRYGLATNPAAVTAEGVPAWRAILDAGISIGALFGPEHGFRGAAQDAVHVEDEVFQGIPSYSLYGKRLKPEPWMLDGLDAVVFDMQDVGCRYYTFLYTLANIMEVCVARGTPLVVLDRPNPLGGSVVEGGPLPDSEASFVGACGLAPRYGMTIGEFATYLAGEYFPGCTLEVLRLEGWEDRRTWSTTGLPWPLPSPNIPSLSCAEVYPGMCLVEGTWLSEGRGTARPFEIAGAPWLDGERVRERLRSLGLPGVVFSSVFFAPAFSKHSGESCEGVLVSVVESTQFRSLDTGIAVVRTLREMYPRDFRWREDWVDPSKSFFDRLAGGPGLRTMIEGLAPLDECLAFAREGRERFLARRAPYLLY